MNYKKELDKIGKERGITFRDYQERNILDYLNPKKPHVYAAATAAGKTITTAAKFELYYRLGLIKQHERVLIIPADKTILRGNFVKQFKSFFNKKESSFTWVAVENKNQLKEAIDNKIQVIIGLPQLVKDHAKTINNVKWLVVDESHKWYFADTIKGIIKDCNPKYQFLLTGTPFKFNRYRNNYIIDYTSISTLYNQGYIDDVNLQVLHTSLALTRMDWVSMTDNLRPDKKLSKKELNQSLSEMIVELIKKLKIPIKDLTSTHNISKNVLAVFGKLQKTIIFTHRTDAANIVAEYLKVHGVNCIVSHSKVDGEVAEDSFNEFRTNDDIKVMVSVERGKEGFDFPELYNIIDMTYSQNFEVVLQMIGRLLRKSKNKTYKVFYKVAPKNTSGYFTSWMDCLVQLFDDYWYSKFNGRNTLDIRVPNALLSRPTNINTPTYIQDGNRKIEIVSGSSLTKGTKIQVIEKNKKVPLKDGKYKIPQPPTRENPKPQPIEIEVKKGIIVKTPVRTVRGIVRPKNLETMGFDLSISFMEKNDWFRLEDPLSTVSSTSLKKIISTFDDANISNRYKKELVFKSFEECKEYIKTIDKKWRTSKVWKDYCQSGEKPDFIPSSPYKVFKEEWTTWSDWLAIGYLPLEETLKFVHKLNLTSEKQWQEYCRSGKKPDNIPSNYRSVYKNITTGEFLGHGRIADNKKEFLTISQLQKYCKKVGVTTGGQYDRYWKENKRPDNIPANPPAVYKNWKGWPNFFKLK
jgi:superfamily II DNA or RNA helicase